MAKTDINGQIGESLRRQFLQIYIPIFDYYGVENPHDYDLNKPKRKKLDEFKLQNEIKN
jgi:hypothetical protein